MDASRYQKCSFLQLLQRGVRAKVKICNALPEMEKAADGADMSVLFFSVCANF